MIPDDENVAVLIDAWKLMTGRFAGSDFERAGGVASAFANLPLPFFNISFQDQPAMSEAELRGMLSVMQRRAQGCAHPSMIALCQEWVPGRWREIAAAEGFRFSLNMTGMATEALLPPRRPPPKLAYRRVQDDAEARDLAMINAQAYGLPAEMWECLCNLLLWQPDSYAYVAYDNGRAVAAASSLPVGEVMYIALVATLPEQHGKGYAEAVMRQAIEQGKAGMGRRRIVLHASDMGQPLYQSMGFEAGSKIPLFSPA
jgi:ribosomal protein S18 acetylase RimI-like enzyme